jgi:hypothetical protein
MSALELALRNLAAWSLQVAVLGLAAAALARLFPVERPAARLVLGQALLALVLGLPLVQPWHATSAAVGWSFAPDGAPRPVRPRARPPRRRRRPRSGRRRSPASCSLGVAFRLARLGAGLARLRSLRRRARPLDAPPWLVARRDDVAPQAAFLLSDDVDTPATFGLPAGRPPAPGLRDDGARPPGGHRAPRAPARPTGRLAGAGRRGAAEGRPLLPPRRPLARGPRPPRPRADRGRGGRPSPRRAPGVPRLARRGRPDRRPSPRGPGRALPSREPPPGAGGSAPERGLHVPLPHRRPPGPDRQSPSSSPCPGPRPPCPSRRRRPPLPPPRSRSRTSVSGPRRAEARPPGPPRLPGRGEDRGSPGSLRDRGRHRQGRGHQGGARRGVRADRRAPRGARAEEGHARGIEGDSRLAAAALDAVKQWRYEPISRTASRSTSRPPSPSTSSSAEHGPGPRRADSARVGLAGPSCDYARADRHPAANGLRDIRPPRAGVGSNRRASGTIPGGTP